MIERISNETRKRESAFVHMYYLRSNDWPATWFLHLYGSFDFRSIKLFSCLFFVTVKFCSIYLSSFSHYFTWPNSFLPFTCIVKVEIWVLNFWTNMCLRLEKRREQELRSILFYMNEHNSEFVFVGSLSI